MRKYTIKLNDAGQRLDKFIFKLAPKLPKSLLHKAIRKKDVKLNGKATEASRILVENDLVELYLHSKFFAEKNNDFLIAPANISIVFEDKNLMIVNKPTGMLMHQGSEESKDNLTNRMLHYLYDNGEFLPENEQSFSPAFCNRLDRNTSGLVLAAKNFATLQLLNEKMKNREILRKYYCEVEGTPCPKENILHAFHCKDQKENKAVISQESKEGCSPVETRYQTLSSNSASTILDVELITGKFHQIRAQLSFIGHPIVGDKKYGSQSKIAYQRLMAYYVGFEFTTPSQHLDYLNGKHFQLPCPF